jgi:hypothetical protein
VFDEIAVVDEVHRFAFVDAGRPPRDIAGDAFTAIENVKFFDAWLARLRIAGIDRQDQCQNYCHQTTYSTHVISPSPTAAELPADAAGYYSIADVASR